MQNNIDRAVQFMPFDALKGFREALEKAEKVSEDKKEFCDDYFKELNNTISDLKVGDKVLIKHYYELEYVETIGIIKKIDIIYRKLYLINSIVEIDDIIEIYSL